MRKTFFFLALGMFMASCSNSDDKKQITSDSTAANKATNVSNNPDYNKGLDLVNNNDCFTCHKIAEKFTGPAYVEVAKRYAGKPNIEDTLAQKIIEGGGGNWGEMAMTPHPNISEEDAKAMVKYILTLKDQ